MRKGTRKVIDLRAAAARCSPPDPVRELSFEELCNAYIAVVFDGADLRTRKWIDAFGTLSAWNLERDMLERCMEAMTEAGYRASTINRDISQIGSIYKWAVRKRITPPGFRSPTAGIKRLEENLRVVHTSPTTKSSACWTIPAPAPPKSCFGAGGTSIWTLARY